MPYSKFKDASPEATVETIKKIYRELLNLELELIVSQRADGIYSATLSDRAAMWNTCGKGTTDAFCAASAYGESMEHLCNFLAYDISNLSPETNAALGFEKYPDEKLKDLSELISEFPDILLDMRAAFGQITGNTASDERLIALWKKMLKKEIVPFVPYYSVKEKKYKNVPENLIYFLCGSNGCAAGNTPEEAIGHACDEITERYVKYTIYAEGLTPPVVPLSYIKERCPELAEIIEQLEKNSSYKIIVKDATMGKNYPVMSVAMINRNEAKYLVNFGAHPKFEIALERCLTEMLQAFMPGKLNRRKTMEKWTNEGQKRSGYAQNWVTILKDDSGVVPDQYFAGKPSWNFEPWPIYDEYSNRFGMELQIRHLLRIAPDIYIHDSGYLGFPCYRVYVPTVSTSHMPFDDFQLRCYEAMSFFSEKAAQKSFSVNDIAEVEQTLFCKDTFVNGLIFRSLGESCFHLLHAAACFDLRQTDKAIRYLELSRSEYSECLIRQIDLLQNGELDEDDICGLIGLFYGEKKSAFAKSWREDGAFVSTLKYFENAGIYFSAKYNMKQEIIDATNRLHISLKTAMLNSRREDRLPEVFSEITV